MGGYDVLGLSTGKAMNLLVLWYVQVALQSYNTVFSELAHNLQTDPEDQDTHRQNACDEIERMVQELFPKDTQLYNCVSDYICPKK